MADGEDEDEDEDNDNERGGERGGVEVEEDEVAAVVGVADDGVAGEPLFFTAAAAAGALPDAPGGLKPAEYVTVSTRVASSSRYLRRVYSHGCLLSPAATSIPAATIL